LLIGSITIGMQTAVGMNTIYAPHYQAQREALHLGILANTAPGGGSWDGIGASSLNLRIGTVYLAEGIRVLSGLTIHKVYFLLDSAFLFLGLGGLFFYLKKWLPEAYCLIGVLFVCSILPLTYIFHSFQPWDRIQLAMWILLLYLIREQYLFLFGICLALSMVIKFDTLFLPGLYFLAHMSRTRWQRVLWESIGLFSVCIGLYLALNWWLPSPLDPSRFTLEVTLQKMQINIETFTDMNIGYPPLLVHILPGFLALLWLKSRQQFVQASVLFAYGFLLLLFVTTWFEEVRAQLAVLILVLPAALLSLQRLLEDNIRHDPKHKSGEEHDYVARHKASLDCSGSCL
jgi:hypothetical protein